MCVCSLSVTLSNIQRCLHDVTIVFDILKSSIQYLTFSYITTGYKRLKSYSIFFKPTKFYQLGCFTTVTKTLKTRKHTNRHGRNFYKMIDPSKRYLKKKILNFMEFSNLARPPTPPLFSFSISLSELQILQPGLLAERVHPLHRL